MKNTLTIVFFFITLVSSSQNSIGKAWNKFDKEDYVGTIKICQELTDEKPDFAEAFLLSGAAKMKLDEYSRAQIDLVKSISINPNLFLAYYYMAAVEVKTGKYQNARELVHFFMENDTINREKGYLILVSCLVYEEQLESAMHIIDSIERKNKLDYSLLSWKGFIYEKKDSLDKAIQYYELSIKAKPNLVAYKDAGIAYMKKGNYKKALKRFNKVPKQYDDHPEIVALKEDCKAQLKKVRNRKS